MTSTISESKPSSLRLLVLAPPTDLASKPPFPALLEALSGSPPSSDVSSFAGYTSHPPLQLQTKYYQSAVNIWCDELPLPGPISSDTVPLGNQFSESFEDSATTAIDDDDDDDDATLKAATDIEAEIATLEEWKQQMLSSAAAEVRRVIGGLVMVLPVSTVSSPDIPAHFIAMIEAVHALREAIEDDSYGRDIASVLVLQGNSPTVKQDKLDVLMEKLEEVCLSDKGILGWDFVAWDGQVVDPVEVNGEVERNEYGEQTGVKRVLEVIKGIDWSASPDIDGDDGDDDDDNGEVGFGLDGDDDDATLMGSRSTNILGSGRFSGLDHELQREMMELKFSMLSNEDNDDDNDDTRPSPGKKEPEDEDFQVNQLPALVEQVVAIREAGSEMSPAERERFAKREIQRIMREMG